MNNGITETGSEIFTGLLTYREIEFVFIFSGEELQLIPPKEKRREIQMEWILQPIRSGVYTLGSPLIMEDSYLIGRCNEKGQTLIFLPQVGSHISSQNSILYIELRAYIVCDEPRDSISRLSFTCPEIDYIHPVNQAFSYSIDPEMKDGVLEIKTKNFTSTTTEEHSFLVDGCEVKVKFGVVRGISSKIGEAPLSLKSTMMFEFESTCDYEFVLQLWWIAKDYLCYLCYRKNVYLNKVALAALSEDGKFKQFATLYIIGEDGVSEKVGLEKKSFIKQKYITNGESRILQDIADNTIYLRHLPESYEARHHIDAARFIMITAAFEWEFNRIYPDGVAKSDKRKKAEEAVKKVIEELIETHTGKEKDIYKFLKGLIGASSLQNKVIVACKDVEAIVGTFGQHLYSLNQETLEYTEMGRRLSDQRNHFAHGDLDKDFIGLALLDLIFLEYVIYAMQLKYYGIEDKNIQKAINDLFRLNFAL